MTTLDRATIDKMTDAVAKGELSYDEYIRQILSPPPTPVPAPGPEPTLQPAPAPEAASNPGHYGAATQVYGPASAQLGKNLVVDQAIKIKASSIVLDDGRTLAESVAGVEDRLSILQPDAPLHAEYAELRAAFVKYNEVLTEIRGKIDVWNKLSK